MIRAPFKAWLPKGKTERPRILDADTATIITFERGARPELVDALVKIMNENAGYLEHHSEGGGKETA